ncbi:hypothetical protein SNEBB_008346 [Seison nebaliae]|nr:hypothetical protein SNEBB_008346 [Seison nebaliae]
MSDVLNDLNAQLLRAEFSEDSEEIEKIQKKIDQIKNENSKEKKSSGNRLMEEEDDEGFGKNWKRSRRSHHVHDDRSWNSHNYSRNDGERRGHRSKRNDRNKRNGDDELSVKQILAIEKFSKEGPKFTESKVNDNISASGYGDEEQEEIDKFLMKRKEENDTRLAVRDRKFRARVEQNCRLCIDNGKCAVASIVTMYRNMMICVPQTKSFNSSHILIAPIHHKDHTSMGSLSEDLYETMKTLLKLTHQMNKQVSKTNDYVTCSFEYCRRADEGHHAFLESVALRKCSIDHLRNCFKKAIREGDVEWSINKKLIELNGTTLRNKIPPTFSYFMVCFNGNLSDGYVHLIEDEQSFPSTFAYEIIGGFLNYDSVQIRQMRKKEDEISLTRKTSKVKEYWKEFDVELED